MTRRWPPPWDISSAGPCACVAGVARRAAAIVAARDRPASKPWVGVAEAAAHLACKRQRIYDLVHRRDRTRIPHRKEGGRLLFKLSQLDRWLDSGGG